MANRIYVYPWDQLSEGATAVAAALDCQKILRNGSRYAPQDGDVLINWGAGDFLNWYGPRSRDTVITLNPETRAATDKREFFKRTARSPNVPNFIAVKRGEDRVEAAASAEAQGRLTFPILCRTKVKGKDGEGIVVAENNAQLVDAPLYVSLEAKTAEYRIHMGRDPDGTSVIIGVQQKFLPKGLPKDDIRIRTNANGCYFVWTVDGEPVKLPDAVEKAVRDVWTYFPEFHFAGLDVIYDANRQKAFVIEMNTAPEMTERSAELYAEFFNRYREEQKEEPMKPLVDVLEQVHDHAGQADPVVAEFKAMGAPIYMYGDIHVEANGIFAEGYVESDKDYVLANIDIAVKFLELAGVPRRPFQ